MRRIAAVLVLLVVGGVVPPDFASPAGAASYTLASCVQVAGSGTPPSGLEQLTVEVTATAPTTVVDGTQFFLPDAKVRITNPHPHAIEGSVVGFNAVIPPGSRAFVAGFPSPSPFTIAANGGVFEFGGVLHYIADGPPGRVLEWRPTVLSFNFGLDASVQCTFAPGPPFTSTVVTDAPGYQLTCDVPSLGVTIEQTVDIVGNAPATVVQGEQFSVTDVVATSTPPISTTVLSTSFTLATPTHVTTLSPLTVTTPGPFPVTGGVPFASAPMTFDMRADGPPGSVVEFGPESTVAEIDLFGSPTRVTCLVQPGQGPFATTTIVAPRLDEVAVRVTRLDGRVLYHVRQSLTAGDFTVSRDERGRVSAVSGMGGFPGSAGGDAAIAVRYRRPFTMLRLIDLAAGLDLTAGSWIPVIRIGGDALLGVALSAHDGEYVVVHWYVRDIT